MTTPSNPRRLLSKALPLFLVLAFVLTACAPAAAETPAEETGAEEMAEEEMAEEEMAEEDMGGMAMAGTLRVAIQPLVQTDPALISSDSEVLVANSVYDYLVDIDPESNPAPRLATSWDVSEDGLTYVFTLADGVTFHDGSPFSAEDVVWTFDRLRDPENGFATSTLYENIASIEATGDLEVTFTLSQPNPFFLYDLSDNHALVMKAGTEDPADFNGTGPFVVDSYTPEDRIELSANPDYFVDGQPALESVEIIFFADENAMVDALRGGQADLVLRMSTPLFASLQGVDGIETYDIPTNGFDLIRLRSDREPGNDPRVIQALKLATDRQAILELVQQGYGSVGNDSPIGPLYAAYHDDSIVPPARDVEAARALLADAGYPDGLDLVLHVPNSGGRPDLAAVLQQQWGEAGVNIEISVEPEDVYYGENGWLEVDLGITGWGSRPYPQFYLNQMLVTGAVWNESHFADDEFDQLAALAGSTLDEEERIQAYSDIQQLLVDRGPVIIPYYFPQFGAISDAFTGFQLEAFAGRTDLHTITLK
jgi:peptide/nickel transport system substrate-binding protein